MMKTKYQIFVSSTYEDLKEERDLVIKAILEMGHIPVGMEMFSAGDEEQWKLIQSQIDDCDYYIVISAFRYGSMDGDISYTEKEYDYALSKGIPTLGFVINNRVKWDADKIDTDKEKVEKLDLFKEKIKSKIVGFWKNKDDLYGKVSIALGKQFNTNPRTGWVKATNQSASEVLGEVSRLSRENSLLRKQIEDLETQKEEDQKKELQKLLRTLKLNKRDLSFNYQGSSKWEDSTRYSLFKIYNLIAPELIDERSKKDLITYMGFSLRPNKDRRIGKTPIPVNFASHILADLNVLGVVTPSLKKHGLADTNEYWTLTDIGKKLFQEVRREVIEENLQHSYEEGE